MILRGSSSEARTYLPPRKSVLLLSCMDPRLLDDLVLFMNGDNLSNRYDHVVLAGAALGAMQIKKPAWRRVFFDHLDLAVELHAIGDVYIVEHRNCQAYQHFLGPGHDYSDSPADQRREEHDHYQQAMLLRSEIHKYCRAKAKSAKDAKAWDLKVWTFLMDMRGHVTLWPDAGTT